VTITSPGGIAVRRHSFSRFARLLPLLLLIGAAEDPVDIVAYTDEIPTHTPEGSETFVNPFLDQEELPIPPALRTRIRVAGVGDVRIPRGAGPWGHATWSKYVLVGNYDEGSGGIGQKLEDQVIGVYDTELRRFCELDLRPLKQNASVQWLRVASPDQPQTRIYFSGFVGAAPPGYDAAGALPFGYVEADATNADPCHPDTGWNVVGFTRENLICRAWEPTPGQFPHPLGCDATQRAQVANEDNPCPKSCGFDDMEVLDPETVMLGNWLDTRFLVAKIDSNGVLTVPDVYVMPRWQPDGPGTACYDMRPVSASVVDPTRSAPDLRWASTPDAGCGDQSIMTQEGCATENVCPLDTPGLACGSEGTCSVPYCSIPVSNFFGYTGYLACSLFPNGVCHPAAGVCQTGCLTLGLSKACQAGDRAGHACLFPQDCPGSQCKCANIDPRAYPTQEYRFDASTGQIAPTSPPFRPSTSEPSVRLLYDSAGNFLMQEWLNAFQSVPFQVYRKGEGSYPNEHEYFHPNPPNTAAVIPPDEDWLHLEMSPTAFPSAVEVPGSIFVSMMTELQRVVSFWGFWIGDWTPSKLTLGTWKLPSEAKWCSGSHAGCVDESECPAGQSCEVPITWDLMSTPSHKANVTAGGSPRSLWLLSGFRPNYSGQGHFVQALNKLYLLRVPLSYPVPDSVTSSRPAIAWNGGDCDSHERKCRLWAVALKDGAVKFRVRDDGFWSGWYPLPALSHAATVAPAIVAATTGGVEIFAQGTDGRLEHTYLTSAVTCEAASCTWTAWEDVGDPLAASQGIAAASHFGKKLVVRRANTGAIHVMSGIGHDWSSWVELPGLTSALAPSVTFHSADHRFWIAATQSGTNRIHVTSYDAATGPQPWSQPGSGDPPATGSTWVGTGVTATWLAAPAIASDGDRLHLYNGAQLTNGSATWWPMFHKIENGSGWGDWRPFRTGSLTGWQPAATNVYGDDVSCDGETCEVRGEVLVVTSWPNSGMAEIGSD
jgi:hypothetical protein